MNQDIVYQNREIGDTNPFSDPSSQPETKIKPPLNPKLKILISLAIIIIIILIINLIFSLVKKPPSTFNLHPTPTTSISTQKPIITPDYSNIPPDIKLKFDQIENYNQTEIKFSPPQIDSKIGSS